MSDATSGNWAPYSAFIIDPDPVWRQNAERMISAYAATNQSTTWDDAVRGMRATPTNIVVVGPHVSLSVGDQVAPLLRSNPQLGVLLIMDSLDIDGLREALRAGVREVLPASTSPEELQQAVGRLSDTVQPLPQPGIVPQRTPAGAPNTGKVVMVCAAKGGTGVSTLSVNLAAALASLGKRVALCDADPVFGDIALLLGMKAGVEVEMGDLPKKLQPEEVVEQLRTHASTGVQVLNMFRAHIPLNELPEDLVMASIAGLQAASDVAIIDVPAPLVNVAEYLVHADELLFVAGTDVAALKNVRVARQLMQEAGLPINKAWLVLNRIRRIDEFEPSTYTQIVGLPVVCALPDSPAVQAAGDNSQVLVQVAPKDGVSKAIVKLAQDLAGRFDERAAGTIA
ncbi:MAG TPA: P-loop NTPase [Acidimicrobiales bacterium]|nr:P-loop NTPase [Acidimicrobiales bacterium]